MNGKNLKEKMKLNEKTFRYTFNNILHLISMLEQIIDENKELYIRAWIRRDVNYKNWHLTVKTSIKRS